MKTALAISVLLAALLQPVVAGHRSNCALQAAALNLYWDSVALSPELKAAPKGAKLGTFGDHSALAKSLKMGAALKAKGIDPARCFCSAIEVKHQKRGGDWKKGFERTPWIDTGQGMVVYFAQGKKGAAKPKSVAARPK